MEKKIKVSLDGKELTLNVGIDGFYIKYKEATGEDLLLIGNNMDSAKIVLFGQGATYAGYVCDCMVNKVKPEYTKEQIFEMVFLSQGYSSKLINEFSELNKQPEETGEQNGQLKESVLTN